MTGGGGPVEAAGLLEQEEEQEERLPYWVEATHNLTKEVAGGDPTFFHVINRF